ncbi:MAG: choice-of-anchor tandem repeat GloVer-containing protein, partial [Verrucomicrobiota bacterium]
GGSNGTGTIFRLTPAGAFTNLYSFSPSVAGSVTTNGAVPNALVAGSDGAFYGSTQQGGLDNAGTFFKFTEAGSFTQIYSFNGRAPGHNPITPNSALVQGGNGHFYGTSAFGGSQGGGSIFEITNTGGATVLHSFPQLNAGASAALTLGADGIFYGTTAANGLNGEGTLFRITPGGDFGAYIFSALDTNADNAGGANPSAALTADSAGNLYGTCAAGGTSGSGVIFQVYGPDFIPPFFLAVANPPPALTNTQVGASVTLSNLALGFAPLSYQWLRNGTNLTDGGDLSGSLTSTLVINPVFPSDVGSYALRISNTWGALTSSVRVLHVKPPGIAITSPAPNAAITAPLFAGTATNAPLFTNTNPDEGRLTNVRFSISNLFNGSNITGLAPLTSGAGGASNWSFAATPFPGTNVLSVQSVDVSGNTSPAASETFFYEVPARLTVLAAGSGTGGFTFPNGAMLNLGEGYSITANPSSSIFSNWVSGGVISYSPTLPFIMESNLVLTADFLAGQSPAVFIASPTANARTNAPVFKGTASCSPLLPGVNPNNVRLTNVVYWLTNAATGSVATGVAALTRGATVSNWTIPVTPLPGTNILAVRSEDISGGVSPIVSQTFFYMVPSLFTLLKAGTGNGAFTATAAVAGDTLPTNGAMLNLGEHYTITAKSDPFSTFSKWAGSTGNNSAPTLSFVMQPGLALTAVFSAVPPVVAITSPTANLRTAAPVLGGTASGHLRLTNVSYSLANSFTGSVSNGSAALTAGVGTVSNWTIAVVPWPGTNTLSVQCVDAAGNASAAASRTFFYKVPAKLRVLQAGTGNGTFKGAASIPGDILPTNGAMLNLGEGYAITAASGASSLFSNWVSAAGVTVTPVLSFIMQSNLVLTANFVSNFFSAAAGTYNGLFFPAGGVAEETSGMLYNLVLLNSGACSGSLLTAGKAYPFATNFDVSGHATFTVGRLQVDLALDSSIPQISGTVSSPQWTANLTADLASNTLPSAEYTMLFSRSANVSAISPPGDGYALVTNFAGMVTLSGALADGTSYSQRVPVSKAGDLPVYASLYTNGANTNAGLLLGWINLTHLQAAAPAPALAWIKKPSPSSSRYTNGFTNILSVQGAPWTNPPGKISAISLTNGQLVISSTGLLLAFSNIVVSNNTLTNLGVLPTNSVTGFINPKTGLLNLSFASGNGSASNSAFGAILQNTTNAGGFFLTPTGAGFLKLQP